MSLPYRWVIVFLGGLMGCVAIGAMFSLAVFLEPMSAETGWSRAGISTAMTLDFLIMGVAGFLWGTLSDRYGPRIVTLIGAVLLGTGLVVASRATTPVTFQLGFGLLVGLAAGAFFAPMIAAVTGWFETQRALAIALVSAGMGMAPMTMTPLAGWLIETHDWRTAMAAMGVLSWVLLIPAALFVRGAPATPAERTEAATESDPGRALRSPQFLILAGTFFFCCAAHAGPIFHMLSYAALCGIPTMAAVSVYGVEGFAGLVGRLAFGVAADRLGVRPVIVAGLLLQAVAIPAYLAVRGIGDFYVLATVFGMAYGGVMPLYAALAREYFGQSIMGTVLGGLGLTSSIGMALGPVGGGWVYDTFGTYTWLYLGSAALAVGAVLISLFFPPLPRERGRVATA
ncbi:MAG: MFS transporter [Amaricoccus sp.]